MADNIFPHEFTRQIIERFADEKLKNDANAICLQYPVTAQLLQRLSENYIGEASRDKVWSEIDFD